nr:hypothetical protein [uncultured Sphaerochaeta sp.]
MKKPIIYLFSAIVLILGTGCDLFPFFNNGTIYFYEMAGENDDPSSYRLKHRDDGYTIIMSRGEAGQTLTEDMALKDYLPYTDFSLSLDGTPLSAIGEKTVDELGNSGWHVVQSFTLPELRKGTYTLIGKTVFRDKEGNPSRENEVTLKITSFLSF